VLLEVYSHPSHQFDSKSTLETMNQSLKILSETFGSYPFKKLRIVEIPSHWGFGGFAHSGMISMVEDNYFLVRPEAKNQFDLQRKRVIHEVAHQWFGHQLAPRNIPGASFFVEGLAKYAEAFVMEKTIGKSAIWQVTDNSNRTYFYGRAFANEAEPPLSKMRGQGYLSYGKSVQSLLAVEELIGSEKLNSSIRKLVNESSKNSLPSIGFQDFLDDLKATCNLSENKLIQDWFEKVIHYDIKIETAKINPLPDGDFEIKLTYEAKKLETLTDGSLREIEMNEPITVSLLQNHPRKIHSDEELIRSELFQIKDGIQELIIHSKVKPTWIAIDPWGTRPDQNREDNWKEIK